MEQPRTRNQIATNGGFGFVTWGRPNPALEPGFLAGGPRTQPNIWNKVSGTVTCKTAAGGVLSASITPRVEGTGFPSHKVWWNGKLNFARAQGSFSVLWDLPGVPQA